MWIANCCPYCRNISAAQRKAYKRTCNDGALPSVGNETSLNKWNGCWNYHSCGSLRVTLIHMSDCIIKPLLTDFHGFAGSTMLNSNFLKSCSMISMHDFTESDM